jgi:hypothetical protein
MKCASSFLVLASTISAVAPAWAIDSQVLTSSPTITHTGSAPVAPEDHANPRLKLSYVRFSIGNGAGGTVPLQSLHLDVYALSRRWIRGGFEFEAGRGQATLFGNDAAIKYGLVGWNAGVQIPGRVTPFLEARLAGGVLGGQTNGPITVPGTNITTSGGALVTWIYGRGLEGGAEFYVLGRSYVSVAIGWLRTTWRGADYAAATGSAGATIKLADVTHDSFLLKLGVGF